MKKLINNNNGTFTLVMEGWSVTASPTQLEEMYNKCFDKSIINLIKKANEQK